MDAFSLSLHTPTSSNPFEGYTSSSRSWLEEEINKSIEPLKIQEHATSDVNQKNSTQYQSIIDEFDPMSSMSVSSKVNHFNQMKSSQPSYLNSLTPKPFTSSQLTTNATTNRPISLLNNFQSAARVNPNVSQSQHSVKDLINPTPFYGGFKNNALSQPSFHSVPFPQARSVISSNSSDLIGLQTNIKNGIADPTPLSDSLLNKWQIFL